MNATQTRTNVGPLAGRQSQPSFDWATQIKLAIVLSVVVALTASALAGRLADTAIVIGAFVVAAVVAWRRAEPAPARRPAIVHVRHH
jgi:hypothetical protein